MFSNFRKILKVIFSIVIGLYLFVWLLSPWIANYYLDQYLEPQGLSLSTETSIRYNPFRSRLEINDLIINPLEITPLEITPLEITAAGTPEIGAEKVLSLSFLSFELHLHQLMFEEIHIPLVAIKGLDLSIEQSNGDLLIAGINLAQPTENSQQEQSLQQKNNPELEGRENNQEAELNFINRLVMPNLMLEESNIDFNINQNLHQLKLHKINITDLFATLNKQAIKFSIVSEIDDGPVEVDVTASLINKQGIVDFDVKISAIDMQRFNDLLPHDIEIDRALGLVNYNGRHRLNIQNDSIVLEVEKGRFSVSGLDVEKEEAHLSIGKQYINIDGLSVVKNEGEEARIQGDVTALIDDFSIYHKEKTNALVAIKKINFGSVTLFNDEQGIQKVNLDQINIVNSVFSDNQKDAIPALVKFTSLNILDVGLSQYGIEIGDISLAGLMANAELDESKVLKNLLIIETQENENTASAENMESIDNMENVTGNQAADSNVTVDAEPVFNVKLNSFNLIDEAEIFFIDNSVSPVYQRKVAIQELVAGPFDSKNPEQESVITLLGKSNRYANFSFVTKAKPFLKKSSYKIEGDFKELSLPSLSSYIKQALQYEIESGQLDLGIDVQLSGTQIEGEVHVMLRGIELTAADDSETSSLTDQTSVPFNMALGMLKDGDGNVELDLPISGDTSSPDFGLSGFLTLLIKQATIMGAKDYLVTTFVPYAQVVNIAVMAGEYALKVRVNDLAYSVGKTDLPPDQQEFLQQFSALLKDKDSTQIKLCAIATAQDIGKKAGSDLANAEDLRRLNEISMQRVSIFKAYMIEKENIQSSRLLLCTPQIDSDIDAVPRLSFEV